MKQDYDDLDYYLKIYHSSLSETLKQFDLDVESIYSYETLKTEWSKYSKFGFAMGILGWKIKTTDSNQIKETLDFTDLEPIPEQAGRYKQGIRDLVIHFYNNNFL